MKNRIIISTIFALAFVRTSTGSAEIDAQKALAKIGDFMTGAWTPAIQADKDGPRKHVYAWTLDKKFIRSNGQRDPEPWDGYLGIDLENKQVGWWGFFADGTSGVLHLTTFTEKEWIFDGHDYGPDGKFHRKVVVTITGDGKIHAKIEDTINGKTMVTEDSNWVRHR